MRAVSSPQPRIELYAGERDQTPVRLSSEQIAAAPGYKAALEIAARQDEWLREHGRDGADGRGAPYRIVLGSDRSATMDKEGLISLGTKGDTTWGPHALSAETVRHEMIHATINGSSPGMENPDTRATGRRIHEAWAMVLQTVDDDDWLGGEDNRLPTAPPQIQPYDLADPEIAAWGEFGRRPMFDDMRGIMRIGNAAVRAAATLGREPVAQIWTRAIDHFTPTMTLTDARDATLLVARERYGVAGERAVAQAWKGIDLTPTDPPTRTIVPGRPIVDVREDIPKGTRLLRSTDAPELASAGASEDRVATEAFTQGTFVMNELLRRFGWDGVDGKGMPLDITVRLGQLDGKGTLEANAYSYRSGVEAGALAAPDGTYVHLAGDRQYLGHEVIHTVMSNAYEQPSGTNESLVQESWADVLPAAMWDNDWLIYDNLPAGIAHSLDVPVRIDENPLTTIDEIRSLPGSIDPHKPARVLSLAGTRVADKIGRGQMAQIWFRAMTDHLDARVRQSTPVNRDSDPRGVWMVEPAARATVDAASQLHGPDSAAVKAVMEGWRSIGVDVESATGRAAT